MTSLRDLAELVRAPALLSVPGDLVAGGTAARVSPHRTLGLVVASAALYSAGMAANDWADRELDAEERPERPIPEGRVAPSTALALAVGLTGAGLVVAAWAGGPRAAAVAVPLAGAVWTYDLVAKGTPAGPAVMGACRTLNVLLGASPGAPGSPGGLRRALPEGLLIGAHTWTVTVLSHGEVRGVRRAVPAGTLVATALLASAASLAPRRPRHTAAVPGAACSSGSGTRPGTALGARPGTAHTPHPRAAPGANPSAAHPGPEPGAAAPGTILEAVPTALALACGYAMQYGTAQARALRDPGPGPVRTAVAAGITALPLLQAALTARRGRGTAALAVATGALAGQFLGRKVSPT